ncbi:hypothetical protein C1O66_03575 [Paucibacter aquatile]|uniref:DUF2523 domain-containing protein n=1 Tax=Kinneretia aquatilis TaxID=2070761 RepID=A0A2N8KTA3_9BURK|nr:hypothetical protein C1O66_23375 [Paucibacter aquatile]PND39528.1 hypothetical protein C1O66_03535 [Paucibacter aquatile]PND39530.1 hypothetical protein C1O66_03575 [Paucibacter aquatile]
MPLGVPLLIGSIIGGITAAVGTLVGRVLVSLGVGFVAYQGVNLTAEWIRDQASQKFAALPGDVYTVIQLLQVPAVINVYFSAWMASLVVSGLQSGTIVKSIQRSPGG